MIEIRKLTREEFNDLVANAHGELKGVEFLRSHNRDPFLFYQVENLCGGLLIDGVPVYCGCVKADSHFVFSIMRRGTNERYPVTLYKIVKTNVRKWAKILGDVRCQIVDSSSEEAKRVARWVRKMGYQETENGIFILPGGA